MADYYGTNDYYGETPVEEETTVCDPYYEDCAEVVCDPEVDYDCEVETAEDGDSTNPLVLGWGLIPVMSLAAGFWHMSDWSDVTGNDDWSTAYMVEIAVGGAMLPVWGVSVFM